jgi:hypothetical protein
MIVLTLLFLARVLGQLLVVRRRVSWLPPLEQWQSGLLPYPVLLASQGAILGLQTAVNVQALEGDGLLVAERPRGSRVLRRLSQVYFGSMIFRYCLSMWRYPDRRWTGKTIPIVFHAILASYLFLYAKLLGRPDRRRDCR